MKNINRRNFLQLLGTGGLAMASGRLMANPVADMMSAPGLSGASIKNLKPISGSWIEFRHSADEGGLWNDDLTKFTADQWRRKIFEMREIGMEYLVLMGVAMAGKAFYPSKLAPQIKMVCEDPLEAVLSAADECGIKFFVSNDFWGNLDAFTMMIDKDVQKIRFAAMEEIAEKYSHHESFYGWYFPNEAMLQPYFVDACLSYVNACADMAQRLTPNCVKMIAPYYIKVAKNDETFVRQLEKLNVDIIAYQDGVGVNHSKLEDVPGYFETLYKAHAKASRARLWADMELFYFQDGNGGNLISADFNKRIIHQMEAISPYVDKILCYQYIGIMNKPGTDIVVGPESSFKLYEDYSKWYKRYLLKHKE